MLDKHGAFHKRIITLHVAEFIAALAVGPVAVVIPLYCQVKVQHFEAPLCPLIRTGIENLSILGFAVLACLSSALGCFTGRAKPYQLGLATMSLFPVIMAAEMVMAPRSHNLFPLELLVYVLLAGFAVAFVYLGRTIKLAIVRKRQRKRGTATERA